MSDANIFVSNGTCYSAAGQKLDKSFIPCGNDAFGHQTCCGAGDNCLVDNACWGQHGTGYGSSLTYMAGCTDPEYKDASCPQKFFDQPWVALTHCDNNDGSWAACSQSADPSMLQPGSFCTCTDAAKTTVAFKDTDTLSSRASLPQSTGDSIQFFVGYVPTSPPSSSHTQTQPGSQSSPSPSPSGSPTSPASTPATQTSGSSASTGTGAPGSSSTGTASQTAPASSNSDSSSSDSSSSSSGLSSSAKAGIIGGVVGGAVLLAALAVLFFLRRRRQRRSAGVESGKKQHYHSENKNGKVPSTPTASEADGVPVSEADGRAARPWSMRSELEGSQPATSTAPSSLAERVSGEGAAGVGTGAVGDGHHHHHNGGGELSPVAELPGSESWGNR
ncbi:hypothetical protein B0T24DRAFT_700719 [Lasiosphaeria ovina]|uniref:Uncharacterized protein n=1 Tax=Lasiosphaeria ovina TaxID=92902 RepID=A0AAE0KIJ4_9PEZI|nr:hypothetical protein B0T24DRAFT_700719 [Lasiosphaeria ovina]